MSTEDPELKDTVLALSVVEVKGEIINDNSQEPVEFTWEVTDVNQNDFEI